MQSQRMMERSGKKELLLELSSEGFRRIELASPPVQLEGLRPNTESLGPSYIDVAVATGLSDFRKVCCGSEHALRESSAGAEVPQLAYGTFRTPL